jgi:branched-chain amino acid transport system substrate-binding protein
MRRATLRGWALALGAVGALGLVHLGLTGPAAAQEKKVLIGVQCDRTGPTQIVGTVLCPAMQDYYNYVNSKGGIEGYMIEAPEIDNSYKVPAAIEAYQNQKQQGAVIMSLYGTPQTHALNERLETDHMPTTSPGFGIAASADGKRYPYLFPVAATYFSQGAAAVDFAKRQLGGSLKEGADART